VYSQANEETHDEENVIQSIESIDDQPLEPEEYGDDQPVEPEKY
jgi:hypothetical protein